MVQRRALVRRESALGGAALTQHHRVALAEMAPTGGDREILPCHVVPASRGGDGDHGDSRSQRCSRHAGDGGVGIQQRGKLASTLRRAGEFRRRAVALAIRPSGQRDARPLHP